MESVRSKQVQCEEGVRPFSPLRNKKIVLFLTLRLWCLAVVMSSFE